MPVGSLCIVIQLHVPYVRRAGMWPYGEYQLYEAMADSFIPLLDAIAGLHAEGLGPRFTVALSPLLADQLTDLLLRTGFEEYVLLRIRQADEDAASGDADLVASAKRQKERDLALLESWVTRHQRDIVRSIRHLEREGAIEAIGMPATAAILPMLPRVSAKRAQVAQGVRSTDYFLEHPALGVWLPGGAIAPGAEGEGISDLLVEYGLEYAFVGERAIRPSFPNIPGLPASESSARSPLDTYRLPSGLVALARHDGFHSATITAFPEDPAYLGVPDALGRRYWAHGASLGRKLEPGEGLDVQLTVSPGAERPEPRAGRYYRPEEAEAVWRGQAGAAAALAKDLLKAHKDTTGRSGVVVLPVEAARFAAWPEGVNWLAQFVREAKAAGLKLKSGAEAIHHHDLQSLPDVTSSSWEGNGDFRTWQADNTTWYWEIVGATLDHAENLSDRFAGVANPLMVRLLAQATREALLLVSGEWAAMIGLGGEELDYAAQRIRDHHDRFRRMAYMLDTANPDELDMPLLERYEAADNPFQAIDLGLLSSDRQAPARDEESDYRPWSGMGPGGVI
jgi:1,4-alpha-glucan branching enzyme